MFVFIIINHFLKLKLFLVLKLANVHWQTWEGIRLFDHPGAAERSPPSFEKKRICVRNTNQENYNRIGSKLS